MSFRKIMEGHFVYTLFYKVMKIFYRLKINEFG